jgi:translocation and assembly module TamA
VIIDGRLAQWIVHEGVTEIREPGAGLNRAVFRALTLLRIIPHGFRRTFRQHLAALAGLLVAAVAAAAEAPEAPEPAVRFRVVIDAPKALKDLLEGGLDLVRWQKDERTTPSLLKRLVTEARAAAERAAAAEGYFSAKVTTAIGQEENFSVVRITVEPGLRTTVSAVDIRFRGEVARGGERNERRMAAVRREWRLRAGEPFRQEDWDAAKQGAVIELARELYAAASIAGSEARVDPETRTASLRVELDSGPPFRFGPLRVSGTNRYPEKFVEHLYGIRPGDEYDASRLAVFQRRLLETGYFATAQITVDRDPANADAAPVQVAVSEARAQRIDTGVSFSTDTRLGAQLNYSHQDLASSALRLRSLLKFDEKTQTAEASIDTPPRNGGFWNTFQTRAEATDIQNQRTDGYMLGASYNWGVERTPSQVSLSVHHERQVVVGSDTERHDAVFLGFRQVYRYTDDPLVPRRGVLGSVQVGSSIPNLATQEFVRATAKANLLVPFGRTFDLSARIEGGIVYADSRSGIPSTFLFRTGGDQTIRGYAFQSIGVPEGAAIVGGRYLVVGSVEGTYWFAGDWGAAAFFDAGDAFDDRSRIDLAKGYGVGVRWRSPIGPFRADVAYGQRAESVRLHFSVGFSF